MQPHIINYHKALGYDYGDWIKCEIPNCGSQSVDIHHIIPRSKFGSKRKDEQDNIDNLIGLCRFHHNQAHDNKISKEQLFDIVEIRNANIK